MRRRLVDIVSYITGLLAVLTLIYLFQRVTPDIFTISFGPVAPPELVLDYEAIMIWRERGLDTLLQVLAMSASLLGVLLFMVRGGGRSDRHT